MHFNAIHGMTGTPTYRTWKAMRQRCNDPKRDSYRYYGGRGIKVCKRWDSFERFLADMGNRPTKYHTLDRRNTNGNYTPSNCRWLHKRKQAGNRRYCYVIRGMSIPQLAKKTGIKSSTLRRRLRRGWTDKQLTQKLWERRRV